MTTYFQQVYLQDYWSSGSRLSHTISVFKSNITWDIASEVMFCSTTSSRRLFANLYILTLESCSSLFPPTPQCGTFQYKNRTPSWGRRISAWKVCRTRSYITRTESWSYYAQYGSTNLQVRFTFRKNLQVNRARRFSPRILPSNQHFSYSRHCSPSPGKPESKNLPDETHMLFAYIPPLVKKMYIKCPCDVQHASSTNVINVKQSSVSIQGLQQFINRSRADLMSVSVCELQALGNLEMRISWQTTKLDRLVLA